METAKLTIKPETLAAALKAVKHFMSTDVTRRSLNKLCVEYTEDSAAKLKVTATDGHTLCSVTAECVDNVFVAGKRYEIMASELPVLEARCKAAKNDPLMTVDVRLENGDYAFPLDYAQVIPALGSIEAKSEPIGLNAAYLARVGVVQKALGAEGTKCCFGSAQDAARFDIESSDATISAVVVIMPMRV